MTSKRGNRFPSQLLLTRVLFSRALFNRALLARLVLAMPLLAIFSWAPCLTTAAQAATPTASKDRKEHEFHNDGESLPQKALDDYQAGAYTFALKHYQAALQEKKLSIRDSVKESMGAGSCYFILGNYGLAISNYRRALDAIEDGRDKEDIKLAAELHCSIGEALYEMEKYEEATRQFKLAVEHFVKSETTDEVLMRSLEGIGACAFKDGHYQEALKAYKEVAYRDRQVYGYESVPYGWSLRVLSDIYLKLGDEKKSNACFERSVWIFRSANRARMVDEWFEKIKAETGKAPDRSELFNQLTERVMGKLLVYPDIDFIEDGAYSGVKLAQRPAQPAAPGSNSPWSRSRVLNTEPASTIWADPRKQSIGLIVCVPGFGLHRGSFQDLGKSLSERGYIVFSYDVRGFGAYTTLKSRDRIDLEKSLDDLDDSIIRIRRDFPNLPTFLLGESMGGSIALQFCAYHPELVDGLIASVPSSKRYSQWSTATKVAIGLLTGSREPINVEPILVNRATKNQELRQNWIDDPQSRFTATAKELLTFRRFLSKNKILARQVKTTPVIMFQGVRDLLIKPEGTISLFRAVANDDKDLVLVGKSEHLLFEQGQFNLSLLTSLCEWMKNHNPKEAK